MQTPLPTRVLLRGLQSRASQGVRGVLVDVSRRGLGVLVQEHVALDTRCRVEILCNRKRRVYRGEVCYGTRTESGIRLGILLTEGQPPILDLLKEHRIELA